MSYCQRCGEKNLPGVPVCENCGAKLPSPDREQLQPGYGYNIHGVRCRHGLKLEPMSPGEKLALLGYSKYFFLGNLLLILLTGVLLMTNMFRTDNGQWQAYLEQEAGLFGPRGQVFTCVYILFLLAAGIIAAKPLYTRNTFNGRQLLPAMVLDALLLIILEVTVWTNGYFGDFLGTALAPGGRFAVMVCLLTPVVQWLLIREYHRLKRSGVYHYVAN